MSNGGNGWSTTPSLNKTGVVIDITRLDKITFHIDRLDAHSRALPVTIQGDVKTANLRAAGAEHSPPVRFAQPTCNCLGWLGAALGGGLPKPMAHDGLLIDSIKSLRVALASGDVVTATAHNEHSDLFWAMKGAGPNFGVVLSAEIVGHLATVDDGQSGSKVVSVWQGSMVYTPDKLEDLIEAVKGTSLEPGDLQIDITFINTPDFQPVIQVIPSYYLWDGVTSLQSNDSSNQASLEKAEAACADFIKVGPVSKTWYLLPYDKWHVESDDLCSLAGFRIPAYGVNQRDVEPTVYRKMFDHYTSFLSEYGGKRLTLLFFQPQIYSTTSRHLIAADGEDAVGSYPWRNVKVFTPISALYSDPTFDGKAVAWSVKARQILEDGSESYVSLRPFNYRSRTSDTSTLPAATRISIRSTAHLCHVC